MVGHIGNFAKLLYFTSWSEEANFRLRNIFSFGQDVSMTNPYVKPHY